MRSALRGNSCLLRLSVAATLLAAGLVKGQSQTGEIRLQVKDPSGAPMRSLGKLEGSGGAIRAFETDPQGVFVFPNLPFGRYRLTVGKEGFATQTVSIDVPASTPVTQLVTLALGTAGFKLDVVGTTPLAGADRSLYEIAAPVQTASGQEIGESGAVDFADFLNRRLNGVHLNEVQGNPYQADLNYRGYTASPLLGTPQGLSVYMDGVRLNQPFGDVVSWDLIPAIAIAETTLIPGSNPVFGLNTLGGAVSIQTKDGVSHPGTALQVSGGSFGRRTVSFEHGGRNARGLNWYLASNLFFEDGWREFPSNVRQFLGKVAWQHGSTWIGLTAAYANNSLIGNGLQEQRLLARDYSGVYTKPDVTANRSPFLNLSARHTVSSVTFTGNAYFRHIRTNTLNGDINEDSLDQAIYQPSAADIRALTGAGYTGFPLSGATPANTPFPSWRCIAQALQRDEPAEKCNGLLNRTRAQQRNYGVSGQASWLGSLWGRRNQLTAGAAWDGNSVGFQQSSELGYLNPDRSITGVGAFGDGVTGGQVDGEPFDSRVDLGGRIHTASLYAADTLSIGSAWSFTLSGRFNRTSVRNRDGIHPGGGSGSLDSHSVFDRFNPAAGVTYNLGRGMNAYLSYSEGSRAPTSIEVGCADPELPCKLPNAMAGDPPLEQVLTRTWEAGLRGGRENTVRWSAGWFRAENRHDILFVASNQTGFGYFKNFGRTRRQGVEVDISSKIGRFSVGGGYTFLDATYQSSETVDGSSNSANSAVAAGRGLEGFIRIQPGARIPLVPQHMVKAYADVRATSKLTVDLGLRAFSSAYARGNENNQHQGDGQYYLGPGTSPGYAVVSLGVRYQVHRRVSLFADVGNLLNHRYYSAAQLGPTGFTAQGTFQARPFPAVSGEFPVQHATFYAPGAPRAAWGGLRFQF